MGKRSGYTSSGRSGLDKANKFAEQVKQFGWECKISEKPDGVVYAFARRDENETIEIWWQPPKGAITIVAPPIYKLGAECIKLPNVSACVSIASKPADTARLTKAVRKQRKKLTGSSAPKIGAKLLGEQALISPLSDDSGASGTRTLADAITSARGRLGAILGGPDDDVIAALRGSRIEWVNSQSGVVESAHVNKVTKLVRNGKDYVEFTDRSGFHAVYLNNIIGIH